MLATLRDAIYGWATERMVRHQAAAGLPAFLYVFDHCDAASRARDMCAFHASDVPYVFGLLSATLFALIVVPTLFALVKEWEFRRTGQLTYLTVND